MKINEVAIINENSIKNKIYVIRGEKVMLDFELAEIYGYSTKAFNQQVKNNKDKFEGFIFRLTKEESYRFLWSKKSTLNKSGNSTGMHFKYLPYAFTEQGIYMLMTVLRGPLAVEQSRRLVTIFKEMKDYIVDSNHLLTTNEILRLSNKVNEHDKDISNVKNQLTVVMDNFIDPNKHKEYLLMNGKKFEADLVYQDIYKRAKHNIVIIDNYIDTKTIGLLKGINPSIKVSIYSDNINKLNKVVIDDFILETGIEISLYKVNHLFHDRFILLDNSILYLSGPSSKDAGNKIGMIIEVYDKEIITMISDKINKDM